MISLVGSLLLLAAHASSSPCSTTKFQKATLRLSVTCFTLVLWPSVWRHLFPDFEVASPSALAFVWPYLLLGSEFALSEPGEEEGFFIEPNAMCSLALALSGLAGIGTDAASTRMLIVPLIAYLMVVAPRLPPSDKIERVGLDAMQHAVLVCTTGLLMGALLKGGGGGGGGGGNRGGRVLLRGGGGG